MSEERLDGQDKQAEIREYLAGIRKTIAESEAVIQEAELRMKETDRFMEQHGLTREQVMNFKFTKEQRLAANEELRRLGLPLIEDDDAAFDFDAATAEVRAAQLEEAPEPNEAGDELAARQRKFGTFMQEYRL